MNLRALLGAVAGLLSEKDGVCSKGWYASKTVWFNLLFCGLFLFGRDFMGLQVPFSDKDLEMMSVVAACLGNLVLRLVSKRPIRLKSRRENNA